MQEKTENLGMTPDNESKDSVEPTSEKDPNIAWDSLMKYSRVIRHQYPVLARQLDMLDDLLGGQARDYSKVTGEWNSDTQDYDVRYDKILYICFLTDQALDQGLITQSEYTTLRAMLSDMELG